MVQIRVQLRYMKQEDGYISWGLGRCTIKRGYTWMVMRGKMLWSTVFFFLDKLEELDGRCIYEGHTPQLFQE